MNETERQQKYRKQTNDLYTAVGEFVVKFEHVCRAFRDGITWILESEGLKDQSVGNIIVVGLTAKPLIDRFASLVAHTQDLNSRAQEIVGEILTRARKLIQERNDVIHATWFIGWASPTQTEFSTASGYKLVRRGNLVAPENLTIRVEDLERLTHEAESLNQLVMRLSGCLLYGYDIVKNFSVDSDGKVHESRRRETKRD